LAKIRELSRTSSPLKAFYGTENLKIQELPRTGKNPVINR